MNTGPAKQKRIALAALAGAMVLACTGAFLLPSFQEPPPQEKFRGLLEDRLHIEGYQLVSVSSSDFDAEPWPWSARLSRWLSHLRHRNVMLGSLGGDGVTAYGIRGDHRPALSIYALCYQSRIVRLVVHHAAADEDSAMTLSLALQKICPSVVTLTEPH